MGTVAESPIHKLAITMGGNTGLFSPEHEQKFSSTFEKLRTYPPFLGVIQQYGINPQEITLVDSIFNTTAGEFFFYVEDQSGKSAQIPIDKFPDEAIQKTALFVRGLVPEEPDFQAPSPLAQREVQHKQGEESQVRPQMQPSPAPTVEEEHVGSTHEIERLTEDHQSSQQMLQDMCKFFQQATAQNQRLLEETTRLHEQRMQELVAQNRDLQERLLDLEEGISTRRGRRRARREPRELQEERSVSSSPTTVPAPGHVSSRQSRSPQTSEENEDLLRLAFPDLYADSSAGSDTDTESDLTFYTPVGSRSSSPAPRPPSPQPRPQPATAPVTSEPAVTAPTSEQGSGSLISRTLGSLFGSETS